MSLPAAEKAQHLEESLTFIRQETGAMRKCLESKGKLLDAIKHASNFLGELRTSSLTPKQYYELYIACFDALSYLGTYLKDNHNSHHLADIYELVQYAGNIIPRLYLMINVGTVYMSIPGSPVKEIMKDMMEMCRGVQHPVRGLFLRYYLSQGSRDYLPTGDEDGPEGNLRDSIQFIITNFIEMNKLWVRLQHQGLSRERDKRTKEREELQILVGSNLVRLSQLEGIDKNYYRQKILPAILEQVVQCRDVLAQEYLLDVICQVFPDEFHLHTLDLFLNASSNLNPQVSQKAILLTMINRLADYGLRKKELAAVDQATDEATESLKKATISETSENGQEKDGEEPPIDEKDQPEKEEDKQKDNNDGDSKASDSSEEEGEATAKKEDQSPGPSPSPSPVAPPKKNSNDDEAGQQDLFELFFNHVLKVIQVRPDIPDADVVNIMVGITRLSLNLYPDDREKVDQVLGFCLDKKGENSTLDLLLLLINFYPNVLAVCTLEHYLPLLKAQPSSLQKTVAAGVLSTILSNRRKITSVDEAEGVFGLLDIIIREGTTETVNSTNAIGANNTSGAGDDSSPEVLRDQSSLAKIVHLFSAEDNAVMAKLLSSAKKALAAGGTKIRFTYPALVISCLKLARRYHQQTQSEDASCEELENVDVNMLSTFKFLHRIIEDVYQKGNSPELALRLSVDAASVADQVGAEEASYEYFAQAFTIYEESLSDSRSQYQAICVIAGALQSTRYFRQENYDTLVSKCALYGSKLLKKPDQCRAVYIASHLWWATEIAALGEDENTELFRDSKRVLECLQRALRVADGCMDVAVSVELFVEILNRCLYFFERGNEEVSIKYINGMIGIIKNNIANNMDETISDSPKKHFERTLAFIESRKAEDDRWREIISDPTIQGAV